MLHPFSDPDSDTLLPKDSVELHQKASALPSDPNSAHAKVKQDAVVLTQSCLKKSGDYTVQAIVALMKDQKVLDGSDIPPFLRSIQAFVKDESPPDLYQLAGKINAKAAGAKLLQFVPFFTKTFVIYVADVAMALELLQHFDKQDQSLLPQKPFNAEKSFLIHVGCVQDQSRCYSAEVLEAAQPMRLLVKAWAVAVIVSNS